MRSVEGLLESVGVTRGRPIVVERTSDGDDEIGEAFSPAKTGAEGNQLAKLEAAKSKGH